MQNFFHLNFYLDVQTGDPVVDQKVHVHCIVT